METATNGVKRVLSLREQLASRADFRTKTVQLVGLDLEVTVRRATVAERKEIMGIGEGVTDTDEQVNMLRGMEILKRLVEPPLTDEDLRDLPAIVADQVTAEILKFNGWTKQGAAELVDQFQAKS